MSTPTLDELAHRAVTIVVHPDPLEPARGFRVTAYTSAGGGNVASATAVDDSLEAAIRRAIQLAEREAA